MTDGQLKPDSFVVYHDGQKTLFVPAAISLQREEVSRYHHTLHFVASVRRGMASIPNFDPQEFLVFADACEDAGLSGPILDMLKRLGGIVPEPEPVEYVKRIELSFHEARSLLPRGGENFVDTMRRVAIERGMDPGCTTVLREYPESRRWILEEGDRLTPEQIEAIAELTRA